MTWVRLPDDCLEDPRVVDLDDAPVLAYLRALGWSNRWARNGLVPEAMAPTADVWIDAGLATRDDLGVHLSWLMEYQPTAEEIANRRRDDAERQARRRRHNAGDHSGCDPTRCKVLVSQRDTPRDTPRESETPTRPDPSRPDPKKGGDGEVDGLGSDEPAVSLNGEARSAAFLDAAKILENPESREVMRRAALKQLRAIGFEDFESARAWFDGDNQDPYGLLESMRPDPSQDVGDRFLRLVAEQ